MQNNNGKIIRHNVGLLDLAEELDNLSQACLIMDLSRERYPMVCAIPRNASMCWWLRSPLRNPR